MVVAALALCFLGWKGFRAAEPAPDAGAAGAGDSSYAAVVADAQRLLDVYGQLAQGVVQHDQAHFVEGKLQGIESSLGLVSDRATALGTDEGDALAVLTEFVRLRGGEVRAAAAADHLGMDGITALRAFGREVSLRAGLIGIALETAGSGGDWDGVAQLVAAPWPAPEQEGLDESVG